MNVLSMRLRIRRALEDRAQSIMNSAKISGTPQSVMNRFSLGCGYDFITVRESMLHGARCFKPRATQKGLTSTSSKYALDNIAPVSFVPTKVARASVVLLNHVDDISARVQSASARHAPVKSDLLRFASEKLAPIRSVAFNMASDKRAPVRSAHLN